ncbi:MAG TPA: pyridoxal-dependent decarboxylase [Bacteroidales bacterium]|mgnify:CR=1 FL=1|nr:pyridoxal-dependent decarboxylase [Bacteroidales bacterium]
MKTFSSLDFDPGQLKDLIIRSAEIIEEWYSTGIRNSKIYRNFSPSDIRCLFDEPLPLDGSEPEKLIEKIRTDVFSTSNFNPSPNYYGYITGGGNHASIIAELLKTSLNQNNLKWHSAPANSEIEKIVIKWICQFINYPDNAGGVLVSGGSFANFLNLAVMRKVKCPEDISNEGLYGATRITVYVSEQAHSSIDKAMDMLGLGKKYLRKIPTDNNLRMNTKILEKKIQEDKQSGFMPACIIGIAGTTNNGAVDPLKRLGDIAAENNMWYMVDGAYGLPAAGTETYKQLFEGFEMADSLLINPHKWFFVPFEASCILVKNKKLLRDTFSLVPEYLQGGQEEKDRDDLMNYNLQLTKDFKALKIWMTFKTYGAEKLKKAIENDCMLARYAGDLVEKSSDFELLAPIPLSIVCFRYIGEKGKFSGDEKKLDEINEKILDGIEKDGRIFFAGTKINGKTSLRINLTNHRRTKEDIDYLFKVLREIVSRIMDY